MSGAKRGCCELCLVKAYGFPDDGFHERRGAVKRGKNFGGPLHGNAAEEAAFFLDAQAGVGGDVVFQPEAENCLIKAGLGLEVEEFDSGEDGGAGEGCVTHEDGKQLSEDARERRAPKHESRHGRQYGCPQYARRAR